MAGYKGHVVGGLACSIVYVIGLSLVVSGELLDKTSGILSNWQMLAGMFIVSMLFGLWPDIDTNSRGQDIFFGATFLIDILLISQGYIEAAAYLGLLAMTPIIGKHRGWTHSKLAMIVVPLPIVVVVYAYKPQTTTTALIFYGAAVSGYFSHLLLDGKIVSFFRIRSPRSSD